MGDLSYHYKLHKKDLSDATKIEEIKRSIANLKLSVYSFVIVEMPSQQKNDPRLVFFQTIRQRSFKKTNYYIYELQIMTSSTNGLQRKMYKAEKQRKQDVLQAFETICIQQLLPDLSKMKDITEIIFNPRKKDKPYDLANKIVSQYLHTSFPSPQQRYLFEEALNFLSAYPFYETNRIDLLRAKVAIEHGQYETARKIYLSMTYYDSVTYRLANMICEGKFGKPNYKLTYEYYRHTTLLHDDPYRDMAKIQIARMYRDGKYLKQNRGKYLRIVQELQNKWLPEGTGFDECLPDLYYELALIAQAAGNTAKAVRHCLSAKYLSCRLVYHGDEIPLTTVERVTDLYYSLTDFDANDMELTDLLYLLKKPCTAVFLYRNTPYHVEATMQNGRILVQFGEHYFNGAIDFLMRAKLCNDPIRLCGNDIEFIEVLP